MNHSLTTRIHHENATPGPKSTEYARAFNAMTGHDRDTKAHEGSLPLRSWRGIRSSSKIQPDFIGLHSLFLHILCSVCHCPGFSVPCGAIPRRLQMLRMPSPVQGTGVYFALFFCGNKAKSDKFRQLNWQHPHSL